MGWQYIDWAYILVPSSSSRDMFVMFSFPLPPSLAYVFFLTTIASSWMFVSAAHSPPTLIKSEAVGDDLGRAPIDRNWGG